VDPPPLAVLDGTADLETVGFCQTSLPGYCGMDWRRSILWSKDRYFLFIDKLVAVEAGDYSMRVHWRTPGEGKLDGNTFSVDQQERQAGEGKRPVVPDSRIDAFTLVCLGADKVTLAYDWENVGQWFRRYEYSDPVVSILQQARSTTLDLGDTHAFANLFFTSNSEESVEVEMRSVDDGVVLLKDGEQIVCAGIGPAAFQLGGQTVEVEAEQFVLGVGTIALRAGRGVTWRGPLFSSDAPADVEDDVHSQKEARSADLAKAWADAYKQNVGATAWPATGSRGMRDRLLVKLDAPALCMAEGNVVGETGGPLEVAVGCSDGQVHLLSREGESFWSFQADGGINDLAIADVDGDGRGEVIAGSDDRCCYLLDADGRERWHYEGAAGDDPYWRRYWKAGEVEKVLAADIDGDGAMEVVFAAANMHIHACDSDGELLWRFRSFGVCTSILAADLKGDGRMEVIGGPAKITSNSTCYVIAGDGHEITRNVNDRWASALTAICTADLGNGDGMQVICGTNKTNVYALVWNGDGLECRWAYRAGDVVTSLCAATVSAGKGQHVVVGSASEFVHLVDADGVTVWDARLGDPVTRVASADLDGDGTDEVIASTRNALYVLDEDGSVVAIYRAESPIVSFCLGDGILLVTEDGTVRILDITA
ncbi:MAG: VCBS repeat-containing protein, partial [Candidatus Latescibacteria bacterium]|nr:VCBS repeat-containing protein [Candidatus Latescibacterota bacterium]